MRPAGVQQTIWSTLHFGFYCMGQARASTLRPQADQTWPGVTVILPVKGHRKHSHSNWSSHVRLRYAGPVEFLFVVDSRVSYHAEEIDLCGFHHTCANRGCSRTPQTCHFCRRTHPIAIWHSWLQRWAEVA